MGLRIKKAREKYLTLLDKHRREKATVIKECSDRCLFDIKKATTVETARSNFKKTPWGFPAKVGALKKWTQLCTTSAQIEEVVKACGDRFHSRKIMVIERWEQIAWKEVNRAKTADEVIDALSAAPHPNRFRWKGCEPEEYPAAVKAVEKLLVLCSGLEELKGLHSYWLTEDLIVRYKHLKELCSKREQEFREKDL